ncbi:DUF3024 domain-containing protein [Georgenia yuyongxinii]
MEGSLEGSRGDRTRLRRHAHLATGTPLCWTQLWAIYWRDPNLKFHGYKRKRPTKNVQTLLNHIGSGGDPISWG